MPKPPAVRDSRLVWGDSTLRVLVADGDASFADQMYDLFSAPGAPASVRRASTMNEATEFLLLESPHVAFVAADLPDAAVITQQIVDLTPSPTCVLLTREEASGGVSAPRRGIPGVAGVSAYMAKSEDAPEVIGFVATLLMLSGLS